MRRTVKGYPNKQKMPFLDLALPMLQNSRIFYDSTRPHLHFDGLPPKSRRSVVSIGLRVRYNHHHHPPEHITKKKQLFWFGLEPHMCRLWSKLAHKCIPYNNRCAKFYPDRLRFGSMRSKTLFLSKNREWPCIGLAVNR